MAAKEISVTFDFEKVEQYDFVRFTLADIHGISRGRLIPRKHLRDVWRQGLDLPNSFYTFGPRAQAPLNFISKNDSINDFGNMKVFPQSETLQPMTWSGQKSTHSVGEVLCESSWLDGTPQLVCPRFLARRQLQDLGKLGFSLMSSFEMEFTILDATTNKPTTDGDCFLSNLMMFENEHILLDMTDKMMSSGIDVSSVMAENGPGHFEVTMQPLHGIAAADASFRFRQAAKEICSQHNMMASFMPKIGKEIDYNGFHFNHSLWTSKDHFLWTSKAKDAFHNAGMEKHMSDEAKWWIGGLVKHGRALTGLCCPTVNCYRRMHRNLFCPSHATWGLDNRAQTFRMKVGGEGSTYIESRLPSAACNPYLVLAATVAAGLDGLVNKIPAPDPADPQAMELPHTLEEALLELEKDEVIVKALGSQFVEWFCAGKREIELDILKTSYVKEELDEHIKNETDMYLKFI